MEGTYFPTLRAVTKEKGISLTKVVQKQPRDSTSPRRTPNNPNGGVFICYAPTLFHAFSPPTPPQLERVSLGFKMTGSMVKMLYAFLWQEWVLVFGPNDQLMLRPRINKLGAALMPGVNAFANLLTGFTHTDDNVQNAEDGELSCTMSRKPHHPIVSTCIIAQRTLTHTRTYERTRRHPQCTRATHGAASSRPTPNGTRKAVTVSLIS